METTNIKSDSSITTFLISPYKIMLGFSLIELMLAMFLGSILMAGLIKIYIAFQRNNHTVHLMSDLQTRMRSADYFLENAIRSAGSTDCLASSNATHLIAAIHGYHANNVPSQWHIQPIPNSDVIILSGCKQKAGKIQFLQTAYFIGDTHRQDKNQQPIYALYQKYLSGRRRELIENINYMKIKYGIYNPNIKAITKYTVASAINHWDKIKSVQLQLIFKSISSLSALTPHCLRNEYHQGLKTCYFFQPFSIYAAMRAE